MSETGNIDIGMPDEGSGKVSEQVSEQAKEQFAAAAAAMKALQRDEKRSKKRDDRIARTIIKFLNDEEHSKFFVLISRLVATNCPSIFIVALLSLIDEECRDVFADFMRENELSLPEHAHDQFPVLKTSSLDAASQDDLLLWVTRMQVALSVHPQEILSKLIVDGGSLDGTVLQLGTFVLQDFFKARHEGQAPEFDKLHLVTAGILQSVFEPFMDLLELPSENDAGDSDED